MLRQQEHRSPPMPTAEDVLGYASRKRSARPWRNRITMPANRRLVQIVLTQRPRPKPRRLANRSPRVVPAVRAATMVSQYQGFVILPYWSEMNQMQNSAVTSKADPYATPSGVSSATQSPAAVPSVPAASMVIQ